MRCEKAASLCCNKDSQQASLIFKIATAVIWILYVVFYVLGVTNFIIAKDVGLPSEFQSNFIGSKSDGHGGKILTNFVEAERQLLRLMKAQAASW